MEQQGFRAFLSGQWGKLGQQALEHTGLTFISLLLAVCIGLPLGILISRRRRLAGPVLGFAGILQTIPSIALLGFMIPLLGIGPLPAIAALFLYALLPIIRNTYTGITGVDAAVREAAVAMGMTGRQVLQRVELPLAMPVILAGIRTATVINVGVATLAAYIAAGGLGEFIFGGIALNNTYMILAGAVPAAGLALLFDFGLSRLQRLGRRRQRPPFLAGMPVLLLLLASLYWVPRTYGSELLAGFTPEFMGRSDGDLGLRKRYGLRIRTVVISDAVMYRAAYEHKLDVISGYSTDGRLKAFDLVTLADDKRIFPPYDAVPIVRQEALRRYPELAPVLNLLAGRINDSMMTALNYQADFLHYDPETIARRFLNEQGLLRPARNGRGGVVRIGSKIFGEQYILTAMYRLLIEGHTDLQVETRTGLGGTKICFEALRTGEIDLYPEYTGTGLLVILQTPQVAVDSLITSPVKVYRHVQQAFARQYGIAWLQPIGFNNTYALMMRRQQSAALGIASISGLKSYLDKN